MTKIIIEPLDQNEKSVVVELKGIMQDYFDEFRSGERKDFECRIGTIIYKIRLSDF